MGKNKGKQKRKTDAVFKVAGHNSLKAFKGRTKPVKTNLKQINIRTREQVDKLDEKLKNIQELITVVKKPAIVKNVCEIKEEVEKMDSKSKLKPEISIKESVDNLTDLQRTMEIRN